MSSNWVMKIVWALVAVAAAVALGVIALTRGESINAIWLVVAAACCYALGYRFYSSFIAAKVLTLDAMRATPAERFENGRDFVRTNKWVVFGHHFAAIAGPGPLIGPVLAAQFGYLPGVLWIVVGAVFGGCVQDFVILVFSVRRDGKSLGQMARDEIGRLGGVVAFAAVFGINVVLLGVIALIVVNALRSSPWGTFTIAMTIPIAMLMGIYLRYLRPKKVLETSILGFILVMAAIFGGQWVSQSSTWGPLFTFGAPALAIMIIIYGFAASALPVWLLLAPRDYLSTFVKLGTIAILALGIVAVRPTLHMPPLTRFTDGTGPAFAGSLFPFAFITIACGAISGFHSLISSGTTPKLIARETQTRFIGYGAMMAESFVGVMAIIAACVLQPGTYFAINSPAAIVGAAPAAAAQTISGWGYPITASEMAMLAKAVGETTLFNRIGGAPAFAVGMAHIFSQTLGGERLMAVWYHFAIMFEALFILTVLDAGTRVARFMLQEGLGAMWAPMGRTSWYPSIISTSAIVVGAWGYFLWQGVKDPLGGINSLWPLFGIANQLLATVALCVATTIIIKAGKARFSFVTLVPLVALVIITFTASYEKVFNANPRIGFLSHAQQLLGEPASTAARAKEISRLVFDDRLDAIVTGFLIALVVLILGESMLVWFRVLSGRRPISILESPAVETRFASEEA
ncbi:MAG: carbon starvation protein CstA [Acidobacteriales bacterium]|nr:carbon starvation protein CstA [Terriglobales bacterium]